MMPQYKKCGHKGLFWLHDLSKFPFLVPWKVDQYLISVLIKIKLNICMAMYICTYLHKSQNHKIISIKYIYIYIRRYQNGY